MTEPTYTEAEIQEAINEHLAREATGWSEE